MSSDQQINEFGQTSKPTTSNTTSKRIHLSGLNVDQCSLVDLQDRFKSFDLIVSEIYNWPPKPNAVDQPTDWCFLTLNGDENKVKRAIGVLHGTMWKGKKLRISQAKQREWQARTNNEEDDKKEKKKKQKKKNKFLDGEESENLHNPITEKDVKEGEWGWKQTPAGHLIRPMHMRPDRPLPPPKIIRSEEEKKQSSRVKKGQNPVNRPLIRSKRVTIDPTRYGAVHLSELMLEDGSIDPDAGFTWICEEGEEDGKAQWKLLDKSGDVLKTETVNLRSPSRHSLSAQEIEDAADIESSSYSDEEEEEDEEDAFDEINAAIDQASDLSDSDVPDQKESDKESAKEDTPHDEMISISYPPYDPEDEDAFSDGYQEMFTDQISSATLDQKGESSTQLALLQRMFGEKGLQSADKIERKHLEIDEEESSDDEVEGGVDQDASEEKSDVQPSESHTIEEADGDNAESMDVDDQQEKNGNAEQHSDHVEMTTLTDMFRPKEVQGGFSIMANLDLELDDEFNFEPDIEEGEEDFNTSYGVQKEIHQAPIYPSSTSSSQKYYSVYPTLDFDGHIRTDGKDLFSVLARQLRQSDTTIPSFFELDDAEIVAKKWEERKSTLTQVYKRRHREAIKKKKRNFVGSRAAGTALPGRRMN